MRRMNTSLGSKFLTLRIRIATLESTEKKANCVTSGSLQFIKQIELIANNMRIILYDTFKVFSNAMLPVNMLYGDDELARARSIKRVKLNACRQHNYHYGFYDVLFENIAKPFPIRNNLCQNANRLISIRIMPAGTHTFIKIKLDHGG